METTLTTWEQLDDHPVVQQLGPVTKLALVCEYVDFLQACRANDTEPLTLVDFIDGVLAPDDEPEPRGVPEPLPPAPPEPSPPTAPFAAAAAVEAETPITVGAGPDPPPDRKPRRRAPRPAAEDGPRPTPVAGPRPELLGRRVVYRFPGNAVLSDEAGVTKESLDTVTFTDVDGATWSNIAKAWVTDVTDAERVAIHVAPREAREFARILDEGRSETGFAAGEVIRNLKYEFPESADQLVLAVVAGDPPYVDRFVRTGPNRSEDDQKPTRRIFGDHAFRRGGRDYIVSVVTP